MSKKDSRQAVEVSVARRCQYRCLLQLESLAVTADHQLRTPPSSSSTMIKVQKLDGPADQ